MNQNWKNKFLSARPELVALGLLVPLIIILGVGLTRLPVQQTDTPTLVPLPSSEASPQLQPLTSAIATATPFFSLPPAQEVVTLEISPPDRETQLILLSARGEISVADALKQAQQQGLQLQIKDFGGSLGLFVEAMNGVKNDEAKQMYWTLYVNNQRSPLGASSAMVKPGDVITWKYENVHEE